MTHALELRDLRKSFGKTEIIRGVNLAVDAGDRIAIIGPNGAGKSTLFNLISGRFEPTSGDVLLNGKRINGLRPYQINREGLSRSFQITNIFGKLSVFENLAMRRALESWLQVHVPEIPRQSRRCKRAGRRVDAHDPSEPQA